MSTERSPQEQDANLSRLIDAATMAAYWYGATAEQGDQPERRIAAAEAKAQATEAALRAYVLAQRAAPAPDDAPIGPGYEVGPLLSEYYEECCGISIALRGGEPCEKCKRADAILRALADDETGAPAVATPPDALREAAHKLVERFRRAKDGSPAHHSYGWFAPEFTALEDALAEAARRYPAGAPAPGVTRDEGGWNVAGAPTPDTDAAAAQRIDSYFSGFRDGINYRAGAPAAVRPAEWHERYEELKSEYRDAVEIHAELSDIVTLRRLNSASATLDAHILGAPAAVRPAPDSYVIQWREPLHDQWTTYRDKLYSTPQEAERAIASRTLSNYWRAVPVYFGTPAVQPDAPPSDDDVPEDGRCHASIPDYFGEMEECTRPYGHDGECSTWPDEAKCVVCGELHAKGELCKLRLRSGGLPPDAVQPDAPLPPACTCGHHADEHHFTDPGPCTRCSCARYTEASGGLLPEGVQPAPTPETLLQAFLAGAVWHLSYTSEYPHAILVDDAARDAEKAAVEWLHQYGRAVQPDALLRDPDPGHEKPDDEREDDCGLEPDAPLPRCNCVVARGGPGSVNKYGPHHSYECPMHKAGGLLPDGAQPQPEQAEPPGPPEPPRSNDNTKRTGNPDERVRAEANKMSEETERAAVATEALQEAWAKIRDYLYNHASEKVWNQLQPSVVAITAALHVLKRGTASSSRLERGTRRGGPPPGRGGPPLKLLRWAIRQIEDAATSWDDNGTPDHSCEFALSPDKGACCFHENYWAAKELLGELEWAGGLLPDGAQPQPCRQQETSTGKGSEHGQS